MSPGNAKDADGIETVVLSACSPTLIADEIGPGSRRILLFGKTGCGKSTLARELGRVMSGRGIPCFCLGADPGSPGFGVPGAVNLGRWETGGWQRIAMAPICSLNAGRFRLPLVSAARQIAKNAESGVLLVDAPGIIRGVAAAELLTGMVKALSIQTILVLCRQGKKLPCVHELMSAPARIFRVEPSPLARCPERNERMKIRTRLWDVYLEGGKNHRAALGALSLTGTPPPVEKPDAWQGRQVAFMKGDTPTVMGEVVALDGECIWILAPGRPGSFDGLKVRDAVRSREGFLQTAKPVQAGLIGTVSTFQGRGSPRKNGPGGVIRMGDLSAYLMNGVSGDPLVHLRIMNQKRSMLFDLGGGQRLSSKLAHQLTDIFITHAHMDHISGFFPLLRTRIGDFSCCNIYGPPGITLNIQGMVNGVLWDRLEGPGPGFRVHELAADYMTVSHISGGCRSPMPVAKQMIRDNIILKTDSFNVSAIQLDHGTPVMAYKIELLPNLNIKQKALKGMALAAGPWLGRLKQAVASGSHGAQILLPDGESRPAGDLAKILIRVSPARSLVYATDFADTPRNREQLIRFSRNAHTLFCEAAFTQAHAGRAESSGHLTARACGEIAGAANVGQLVPFHFSKRYDAMPGMIYDQVRSAFAGKIVSWP